MSLVSNIFVIFVLVTLVVYYCVPKKYQWCVLLACSYWYYAAAKVQYVLLILFSTIVTFTVGRLISKYAESDKRKSKMILVIGLILNFGTLGIIKYTNFVLENINAVFQMDIPGMTWLLPLGISFYTFQSSGYMLDVYWKRTTAEKNIFKYGLFVSFFPQILQGPIGRHSRLQNQLCEEHVFAWNHIANGMQRILWGFFKKMILADWSAVFVDAIFGNPEQYSGIAVFGVLFYSVQLYADFSGGMDVVIGIASMFGIQLDENFKRPYFATSITDFWHRWHITLGTWMKDYVFYPVSLSKAMNKLGKWGKKHLGKKTGRKLPICFANLIVFFLVGVWHGAAWKFIAYGMFHGCIIAFSGMMTDVYRKQKQALHIKGNEKWYYCFTVARTFLLVNISWFFDRADTVSQALYMMKQSVTSFVPAQLMTIPAGRLGVEYTPYALLILGVGVVLHLIVSVLEERGVVMQTVMAKRAVSVRFGLCVVFLICIVLFGPMDSARGFIYAQF